MELYSKKIISYAYDISMTVELERKTVSHVCWDIKDLLHSDL